MKLSTDCGVSQSKIIINAFSADRFILEKIHAQKKFE